MLYNKKNQFFHKIAAKFTGKPVHTRKCRSFKGGQKTTHAHQDKNGQEGQHHLLIQGNLQAFCANSMQEGAGNNCVPNKTAVSGLIAAKMRCDEWGLQTRVQSSPPKPISIHQEAPSVSSSKLHRPPTKRSRPFSSKILHPSHKLPTAVRSTSMKERREAMKNTKSSYHRHPHFSPSLYDIDEMDERELN